MSINPDSPSNAEISRLTRELLAKYRQDQEPIADKEFSILKTAVMGGVAIVLAFGIGGALALPGFNAGVSAAEKSVIETKITAEGTAEPQVLNFIMPPQVVAQLPTIVGYNVGLDAKIAGTQFGIATLQQNVEIDASVLVDSKHMLATYDPNANTLTYTMQQSAFSSTEPAKLGSQRYVDSTGSIFTVGLGLSATESEAVAGVYNSLPWVTKKIKASDVLVVGPVGKKSESLRTTLADAGDLYAAEGVANKCVKLISRVNGFEKNLTINIVQVGKSQLFEDNAPQGGLLTNLSKLMAMPKDKRNKVIDAAIVVYPDNFVSNIPADPSIESDLAVYETPHTIADTGATQKVGIKSTNFKCDMDKNLKLITPNATSTTSPKTVGTK